ncbi:MAG: MutS-related protein [Ferrimicrobium sp.]
MNTHLLFRDSDFDDTSDPPWNHDDLVQDLDLTTLFDAMACGDDFLFKVADRVVLSTLLDAGEIAYRQSVLADCISHPDLIRRLYKVAVEAIQGEREVYGFLRHYPTGVLHRSLEVLVLFVASLRKLRAIVDANLDTFASEGMKAFVTTIVSQLDDEYLDTLDRHLRTLSFRDGMVFSAQLGRGNKGVNYVLRTAANTRPRWVERIGLGARTSYSFDISPRDEAGARALAELSDRGINLVANAVAQSTDHILGFFTSVRSELGFYIGCLNLHERLVDIPEPICTPRSALSPAPMFSCSGLYDVCLALRTNEMVVGNDVEAEDISMVMITGANSGGKSTFLRSVGLAQIMMQCGMFVPAKSLSSSIAKGLLTHFQREEDAALVSGRLDEELRRMSAIADALRFGSLVLFNESFAATNEREGSEIARQVVRALMDSSVRVFYVTHLFDLAQSLHEEDADRILFLRAQRGLDGERSFKILPGAPLSTSHGDDLYRRVGGWTHLAE